MTEDEDRQQEVRHVKEVFRINGYKPWAFKIPPKRQREEPTELVDNHPRKFSVKLPYVKGASEAIQRILRYHGVPSFHKPFNTLRDLLVRNKEKYDPKKLCGVVYDIT